MNSRFRVCDHLNVAAVKVETDDTARLSWDIASSGFDRFVTQNYGPFGGVRYFIGCSCCPLRRVDPFSVLDGRSIYKVQYTTLSSLTILPR